jgi:hypothetical protein
VREGVRRTHVDAEAARMRARYSEEVAPAVSGPRLAGRVLVHHLEKLHEGLKVGAFLAQVADHARDSVPHRLTRVSQRGGHALWQRQET